LDAPSTRFRVEPTESGLAVLIDHAEGGIAGGTVSVDRARFDVPASRNAFEIGLHGLSLDRLLRDYAMEGMTGTGTLAGMIPVTLSPEDGVTIDSGTVRAEGDGVLKVDWGSSRAPLVGQGEQVALMVRTLEDFHYSTLRGRIDRPREGELSFAVTLEGRNPAVMDGHPFRFNISLSGELEKVLAAIREGRRLGTSLLRGDFGGGP
jgi:hypothetical protein